MTMVERIREAFVTYRREYPQDDYSPRGVRSWREYPSFWAVLDDGGRTYPLKKIYSLVTGVATPDFHTHDAQKLMSDWNFQTTQLRNGDPQSFPSAPEICDLGENLRAGTGPKAADPPASDCDGYALRTKSAVKEAQRTEAELLGRYRQWLKALGRNPEWLNYDNGTQCDHWESERENLVEAKASARRADIRMAVGQLLDYAFQGFVECRSPHKGILLPELPDEDCLSWLRWNDVFVIWPDGSAFLDNAGGQFTLTPSPERRLLWRVFSTPGPYPTVTSAGKRAVSTALSYLSPPHRRVLTLLYGFGGREPIGFQQASLILGVSEEEVRQLEKGAIRKLRHPTVARRLKDL